jgi:hypothetical protein
MILFQPSTVRYTVYKTTRPKKEKIMMEIGYTNSEATIIDCGKADRAYLGTLGDPLPESSDRGQVQLDEIQPITSNKVLHQVDTQFHMLGPLYYETGTLMH